MTRELARNSECSTPVRPFYGQGGHVVFPAPSGLNGQTKRSERRPAGRARRAPAPGAGPQWAPRVPWGAQPEKKSQTCGWRSSRHSTFTKCRLEALAAVSSKWYLLKARNWFVNVADVEIVAASVAAYKTPVHALRAQVPIVLLSAVLKHYFALA